MVSRPGTLPPRRLGRTDLDLPILSLGGSHLSQAPSERAARTLVETALEEGIRFFDTAESYGDGRSERWLGAALRGVGRGMRDRVMLMSKTFAFPLRSADSARRHLEGTLERLQTDRLDLWQLHSVRSVADVDRAFGPGGAMEYILEAKAQGIVRYVGVTGHVFPAAQRRALDYWDRGIRFDAMQMPLNPIDFHQQSFEREVLPELGRRGIRVIAMKTSADGRLLRERICTIAECLRYVWSLPVAVAVVGMERPELVRANAGYAREFRPMSAAELDALRERIKPRARLDLEWYKAR
ncbi:MAG TPA: aldo/keto reductase [Gemmatimonadales bacterium]|nr:aldo/keto reductase [Gemmatimonadales bacterium]